MKHPNVVFLWLVIGYFVLVWIYIDIGDHLLRELRRLEVGNDGFYRAVYLRLRDRAGDPVEEEVPAGDEQARQRLPRQGHRQVDLDCRMGYSFFFFFFFFWVCVPVYDVLACATVSLVLVLE